MQITSEANVGAVTFLADGTLAGNCSDDTVRIWDAATGQLKRSVKRDKGPSELGAGTLLVGAGPAELKVWDLATGAMARRLTPPAGTRLRGGALGTNAVALATRPDKDSVDTIHLAGADGAVKHSLPAGIGGVSEIAISPDGATVVAASYDTDVRAWSVRNGELLAHVTDLPVAMFAMAFSPDGRWLAAAGADRVVHLFDVKTWKAVRTLRGQNEMIASLAFSADGRRMLTGGFNDITVKHPVEILLWDLADGSVAKRFPMPGRVGSVAFSPDGRLGAAALGQKTVPLLTL
jgi:WD40 repeat protein